MSPSFSVYLEVVRIASTLVVVLGHGKFFYLPVSEFCSRFHPGRDAVIAFFVLSGYVISWCASERDRRWQRFALQRATRVYSVAVPAVGFSLLAAAFIAAWQGMPPAYPLDKPWLYLPLYLGFAGNLWSLVETPPNNFPYWSLNYEVWYYALFGVLHFCRGAVRWLLAAGVLLLVGPAILALLPLWLAGVALQRWGGPALSPMLARLIMAGTALLYIGLKAAGLDAQLDERLLGRVGTAGHDRLLGTYLVGLLFTVHLAAARCLTFQLRPGLERAIRAAASLTFAVYLFHMPAFDVAQALWPRRGDGSAGAYLAVVAGTLALCGGMGWLTERHKRWYRDRLLQLAARLPRLPPRAAAPVASAQGRP